MYKVSVIVPVYNGAKYLAEALRTIKQQSYPVYEIIVVDDGSSDNSSAIAKTMGVTLIKQAHLGAAAARNAGVRAASGEVLAFLDADDLWSFDKLARQVACLTQAPIVYSLLKNFKDAHFEAALLGYHVDTLCIEKKYFEAIGFFDESIPVGEFKDWFERSKQVGTKFVLINEALAFRRLHEHNLMRTQDGHYDDYLLKIQHVLQVVPKGDIMVVDHALEEN
ncbi:MAG: glycosyltransferase family 2 protein [Erysipelotrichaceae bacterium]